MSRLKKKIHQLEHRIEGKKELAVKEYHELKSMINRRAILTFIVAGAFVFGFLKTRKHLRHEITPHGKSVPVKVARITKTLGNVSLLLSTLKFLNKLFEK